MCQKPPVCSGKGWSARNWHGGMQCHPSLCSSAMGLVLNLHDRNLVLLLSPHPWPRGDCCVPRVRCRALYVLPAPPTHLCTGPAACTTHRVRDSTALAHGSHGVCPGKQIHLPLGWPHEK